MPFRELLRLFVEHLESRTLLSAGDLNLAFGGGDGRLRFTADVPGGTASTVVALSNGKFVVGGLGTKSVFLQRFDSQGNLDTSFGSKGIASIPAKSPFAFDFARQSDGKFIIVFTTQSGGTISRFTPGGKLDATFGGGDGIVTTNAALNHVVILANGKIAANNSAKVFEFNTDGSPNNSFGTKGVFAAASAFPNLKGLFFDRIAAQKDNKIVLDGRVNVAIGDGSNPAVFRVTTSGKADTSFSGDGEVDVQLTGGVYDWARGLAIQSNGHIILTASDDDDRGYLLAFNSNGSAVSGFRDNGFITFSSGNDDLFNGVSLYGADNIVFLGASPDPDTGQMPHDFQILGYSSNGVPQFSKRIDFSWIDRPSTDDVPAAATMTADGNILVVGNADAEDDPATTHPQIDIASLQAKSGGPSDQIPVTFGDKQIIVTGTSKADTINLFGDSTQTDDLFIEFNGNRTVGFRGNAQVIVNAGDGNDRVTNNSDFAASINGQNGNDTLISGVANDSLNGGSGDDVLVGGRGADLLQGGPGNDAADYSARTDNLSISLDNLANDGAAGEHDNVMADIETILGGSGNDKLVGNPFANVLKGNAGNDTLYGGAGNDTLDGGSGRDYLYGQDGNDTLYAKDGRTDTLDGGNGQDTAQRDNSSTIKDSVLSIESFI